MSLLEESTWRRRDFSSRVHPASPADRETGRGSINSLKAGHNPSKVHMISDELKKVILNALNLDAWDIQDHTVAQEVPGWDSLTHVNVILAVEKHFGVSFKTREGLALKNLGDLQLLVDSKVRA